MTSEPDLGPFAGARAGQAPPPRDVHPPGPVLAIDLGGTKIDVAVVEPDSSFSWKRRTKTLASASPEAAWQALADLLVTATGEREVVACGIASAGPIDKRAGSVSPLNVPSLSGFPLLRRVEELTGLRSWLDLDVKALAIAEGMLGAAVGVSCYLSMVVSTGVGGGIVMSGEVLEGSTGNAGHIGHVIVVPSGRLCSCGARGCLEAEASGHAIKAITGCDPSDAGPRTVERTGMLVGRAVGSSANLLDLRLATVAGSVALGFGQRFFDAAQREVDRTARMSYSAGCKVIASPLGDRGPLVGAAALAWRGLREPA